MEHYIGLHISILKPATLTDSTPQARCQQCTADKAKRKDTRFVCNSCTGQPGLCSDRCFQKWHGDRGMVRVSAAKRIAPRSRPAIPQAQPVNPDQSQPQQPIDEPEIPCSPGQNQPPQPRTSGHVLVKIPQTGRKTYRQLKCAECLHRGERKDRRSMCLLCKKGFCDINCLQDYHIRLGFFDNNPDEPLADTQNPESPGDSQIDLLHGFSRRSDATSVTPMNTSRVSSFGSTPGGRGPRTPDGQYPYPVDHSAPTYPGNIGHSTPVTSSPPPVTGNIEPSAGCSHVDSSQAVAEMGLKRSRQHSLTDSLSVRLLRPRKEQANHMQPSPPPAPGNIEPSAGCPQRSRQSSPTNSITSRTLRPRKEQANHRQPSPPPAPGNMEPSAGCPQRSRQSSTTDSLTARILRPRKEQAERDATGYYVDLDNPLLDEEESSTSDD